MKPPMLSPRFLFLLLNICFMKHLFMFEVECIFYKPSDIILDLIFVLIRYLKKLP